jgi:UDP-N-acetyl-D-mannosaminuronic acid dehydrogenase
MRAVVVALGKIGLPLAVQISNAGHEVVGCDVDERVVELVRAGKVPFPNEPGIEEALPIEATTDTAAAVPGADLVVLVPPLVVDGDGAPDWRAFDSAVADVARGVQPGTTVVVETTVPVGTTRERVAPQMPAGVHVAFSPERVSSGRVLHDLATYPKLVGGVGEDSEARAVELYRSFITQAEVRPMGGAEAAELTKLAETTYRDLNIAFANELARYADGLGLDVQQVIDAANSQPYSHIHRPGVAVGGHCIPVYPRFYLAGDAAARLPGVARDVNEAMPAYAVELLSDLLGGLDGTRVLILGVAYRGGVKETAFSGAFPLRDALLGHGAQVLAADPLFDDGELHDLGFEPWDGEPVEGVVVQTDHREYETLEIPADGIVDGRGIVRDAGGVPLKRIGS